MLRLSLVLLCYSAVEISGRRAHPRYLVRLASHIAPPPGINSTNRPQSRNARKGIMRPRCASTVDTRRTYPINPKATACKRSKLRFDTGHARHTPRRRARNSFKSLCMHDIRDKLMICGRVFGRAHAGVPHGTARRKIPARSNGAVTSPTSSYALPLTHPPIHVAVPFLIVVWCTWVQAPGNGSCFSPNGCPQNLKVRQNTPSRVRIWHAMAGASERERCTACSRRST